MTDKRSKPTKPRTKRANNGIKETYHRKTSRQDTQNSINNTKSTDLKQKKTKRNKQHSTAEKNIKTDINNKEKLAQKKTNQRQKETLKKTRKTQQTIQKKDRQLTKRTKKMSNQRQRKIYYAKQTVKPQNSQKRTWMSRTDNKQYSPAERHINGRNIAEKAPEPRRPGRMEINKRI